MPSFTTYWEKHSLSVGNTTSRYFVIGGTAIGQLYDRQILPWDDDIDTGMARKD